MKVLEHALSSPLDRGPYEDLATWLTHFRACPFAEPIDRAIWGGFHADRLGYAFTAGYSAALSRLFAYEGLACLAATEVRGTHPRAIATQLEDSTVRGEKTFVTLGTIATEMFVVASRGFAPDGKNRLSIVRVHAKSPGVNVTPREPLAFAPEVPHAIVTFENAAADVLPGDGYTQYLKPFRTIEDIHVLAATLGYL